MCECRGSGGIGRMMRAQHREATKQELVALNEFLFLFCFGGLITWAAAEAAISLTFLILITLRSHT